MPAWWSAAGQSALIDTLADLTLTRRMLDGFAELTSGAPIRTLVNTHSDADHVDGNQLLSGAEIVSSRRSAELIRRQDPGEFKGFDRLARGMRVVGRLPLPVVGSLSLPVLPRVRLGSIGSYIGDMLEPFDFDGIDIPAPTLRVRGRAERWRSAAASCGSPRSVPRTRPAT